MSTTGHTRSEASRDTVAVDTRRVAMMIRKRGGYVLPRHEAELVAQVIENLMGRAEFLFQCIESKSTPTDESFDSFMKSWADRTDETESKNT